MSHTKELIARLEIIPIRKVFKNEVKDFTPWLEEHIETLGERLKMELTVLQRENKVGEFTVDLLCEDKDGKPVIIAAS